MYYFRHIRGEERLAIQRAKAVRRVISQCQVSFGVFSQSLGGTIFVSFFSNHSLLELDGKYSERVQLPAKAKFGRFCRQHLPRLLLTAAVNRQLFTLYGVARVPPFCLCSSPIPSFPHLLLFFTFSLFYFLICFTYFLLLSIPSLSTRIVSLCFQAGGFRRRPTLGLVCFLCYLYCLVKIYSGVLLYLV